MLAQRRSVEVAFGYLSALAPGVKTNCWSVAEEAGHEGPHRMQALLGSCRWDWSELRGELAGLAAAWLPCDPGDLIGPGIAVDETAQLKNGDATACVAPQHAGCTGQVENCVTAVFSAYVTTSGQAWADFDVYMPERWAKDPERRCRAGIPDDLAMTTKPYLAAAQLRRLAAAGLPARWAAFDEVYTRSGKLRETCEEAGLAYVGIIPCDFSITLPSGAVIRADEAVKDAVFERRSCGTGTKGPRLSDWALTATASPRHFLLIRRLISRPGQYTFYLCWAPEGRPATMPYFITIAGRRWPVEEDPAGLFSGTPRRFQSSGAPVVHDLFCGRLALRLALRLAAEWCGHVDAAAALARCSRAHGEDGAFVVPAGEPGDADPR